MSRLSYILAFALSSASASAMPTSSTNLIYTKLPTRSGEAPFAPASGSQGPFDICSDPTHGPFDSKNAAPWKDCLGIRDWARDNKGEWVCEPHPPPQTRPTQDT